MNPDHRVPKGAVRAPREQSDLGPYCLQYRLPKNLSRYDKSCDWREKYSGYQVLWESRACNRKWFITFFLKADVAYILQTI